jgi:hypothetical protein
MSDPLVAINRWEEEASVSGAGNDIVATKPQGTRTSLFSWLLWIVWVGLLVIWVYTSLEQQRYASMAIVTICLLILFFAEGLEIAVADLLDKQASQLGSDSAIRILKEVAAVPEWFFAQRQVFVVVIISLMSLMTNYDYIQVPLAGCFKPASASANVPQDCQSLLLPYLNIPFDAPFWFSLAFTTFTVLWWCQVFPKRLAIINSERFLALSAPLWGLIKIVGMLNIPGPADTLVEIAKRYTGFSKPRHLKPSRPNYYNTAAMLYGLSVDRASVKLTVRNDGSALIRERFLVILAHGHRDLTSGFAAAESPFKQANCKVEVKGLYTRSVPERLYGLAGSLDNIFENLPAAGFDGFSGNLKDQILGRCHTSLEPQASNGMHRCKWTVKWSFSLPEMFWYKGEVEGDEPDEVLSGDLAILVYEVELDTEAGAFDPVNPDFFTWTGETPCRRFFFSIEKTDPNEKVYIRRVDVSVRDVEFRAEQDRIRKLGLGGTESLSIRYPLPGAVYKIHWNHA